MTLKALKVLKVFKSVYKCIYKSFEVTFVALMTFFEEKLFPVDSVVDGNV
jgi:hypothetical protein